MSPSPKPNRQRSIPLGVSLSAFAALLIGGGLMIWANRDDVPETPQAGEFALLENRHAAVVHLNPEVVMNRPHPGGGHPLTALHSFSYAEENGMKVVRIRLVPEGDELVLDAATGRLIESRPARPQAKFPMVPPAPMRPMRPIQAQSATG